MTPSGSKSGVYDVTHALDLVKRNAQLSPGELRLLTYLIEETLAGRGAELHQRTIAADVFRRDIENFDPRASSIVRTTAAKLRESLQAYYAGPGQADPVTIELAKGSYEPVVHPRSPVSARATSCLWGARAAMEARTVSGYRLAIRKLDEVLMEAPALSLALALKAEALASQAIHGVEPRPNLEHAKTLAARAVEQPNSVWQAWLARAIVQQALDWNWQGAAESYRKAIELSAGEAAMRVWYAAFLTGRGRVREAAALMRRAVDHFGYGNATYAGDLALALIFAGDYGEAATVIGDSIEAAPNYYQHYLHRAILFEAMGDPAAALRELDRTPLRILERPVTWGLRGLFAGLAGERAVARRRVTWLEGIAKAGRYVPQTQVAACWIGAGNHIKAVNSLEKAAQDREPIAVLFWAYPMTRHLRGERAFEALINMIGLNRY